MGDSLFISAQSFTRMLVWGTLLICLAVAALLWKTYPLAAQGVCIGGLASLLAFRVMARRAGQLTAIPKEEIPYRVYRWTFSRMLIYGGALFASYLLDVQHSHALVGAALGLLLGRIVMFAAAFTAWMRARKSSNLSSAENSRDGTR